MVHTLESLETTAVQFTVPIISSNEHSETMTRREERGVDSWLVSFVHVGITWSGNSGATLLVLLFYRGSTRHCTSDTPFVFYTLYKFYTSQVSLEF